MFNVNREKLDLTALSQDRLIMVDREEYEAKLQADEPLRFDTCMRMSFSVSGDQDREANAGNKEQWVECIQSSYEYLNNAPTE